MTTAVYPGSFDPVTSGHLDIIERAAHLFDKVIVAVAPNTQKNPLFTTQERLSLLRKVCESFSNVSVDCFSGLLVNYALAHGARAIVKGLRAVSDFEFELQMAQMNRRLAPEVHTVFMMTTTEHSYLSSSIVKEIAALGGSVKGLVPGVVEDFLIKKLQTEIALGERE
ncbi:MAG: pantetheine-phosphate adenylyltransferase [Armatimonadetes bacterium]|nr:pantetheine-phosphate adenylyltransferase [Armatimonadota bacterium]